MEEDLISIVIPVYNAALYLPDTIASLKQQYYKKWEAIFVDDASMDHSAEIIQKNCTSQMRLIRLGHNSGAAYARNIGIRAASGRFLCYLDADDLWHPAKLEKQYQFMKERYVFTFTGYQFADASGRPKGTIVKVPKVLTYEQALVNTVISTITVMLDRNAIPEELLLMPEHAAREDTASWWNLLKHGYLAYGLDEPLSIYRRHSASTSANKWKAVWGTWKMYRNTEQLPVGKASVCFSSYLIRALLRRIRKYSRVEKH